MHIESAKGMVNEPEEGAKGKVSLMQNEDKTKDLRSFQNDYTCPKV